MAFDPMKELKKLGLRANKGLYTFVYGETGEVAVDREAEHAFREQERKNRILDAQENLMEALSMEYEFEEPKEGDTVMITVQGKKISSVAVLKKEGGRRSRLHKKTRRSKGKRGYTKRR